MEKLLQEYLGEFVVIYYNDTPSTVSCKKGKLLDFDDSNFKLQELSKTTPTLIPRSKYIRLEGLDDPGN